MRIAAVSRGIEAFAEAGYLSMPDSADSFMRRLVRGPLRFLAAHPLTSVLSVAALAAAVLVAVAFHQQRGRQGAKVAPVPSTSALTATRPDDSTAVASSAATVPVSTSQSQPQPRVGTQPDPALFTDSGIVLPGAGALAWGDFDNDGDLDLVLAGRIDGTAQTAIYRNDGGTFTRTDAELPAVWSAGVAWGDLDNDGDLDLALAGHTHSGPICGMYQNNGGAFSNVHPGAAGAGFASLAWGDSNNDGQLDLAVAGSNHLRLYGNAHAIFTDLNLELGGAQLGSVEWGDVDGDGDADLAVTGEYNTGRSIEPVTRVWRNDGDHQFSEMSTGLPALSGSSLAFADYDNDGDLDAALCGFTPQGAMCRIYRNNGSGSFTDIGAGLVGLGAGGLAWGDYDNDGDVDLVIAGFYHDPQQGSQCLTRLYRNDGGSFTHVEVPFVAVHYASLAWGDYDGDNDLDLAISGVNCQYEPFTRIYRNNCPTPNTPPSPPTNLNSQSVGDAVTFSWAPAADAQTPPGGLFYQLRVGTRPGAEDIYAGMAHPTTGHRRKPGLSGAHQRLSWTVKGLTDPPYYWSVQAVDTAFAGSAWAGEPSTNWSRVHNSTKNTWHETIQGAIDAAEDGDELILGPGVYSGPGNWDLKLSNGLTTGQTRNLHLRSVDPLDPYIVSITVIDCQAVPSRWPHRAFIFDSGETGETIIEGLTIRNASAPPFGEVPLNGGAIYCEQSSPTIRYCLFDNCTSTAWGGAVAFVSPNGYGPVPTLHDCVFTNNRADGGGGAIHVSRIMAILNNCRFKGNAAGRGGAVSIQGENDQTVRVRNSIFDANYATQSGGAIWGGSRTQPEIYNCTLTNNVAHDGGGMFTSVDNYPFIANCLFWGNRDVNGTGETAQIRAMYAAHVRYSQIQGWTGALGGVANLGDDPALADIDGPDNDPATWMDNNLALTRASPGINAGDPLMNYGEQRDIDGEMRVQNCRADIGADESPWSVPRPDFNGDCRVDMMDLRYLVMCGSGPAVRQTNPACADADLDLDEFGDVDADDFAIFQRCWSPHAEPDRDCAD